jgi:hypothetical protein
MGSLLHDRPDQTLVDSRRGVGLLGVRVRCLCKRHARVMDESLEAIGELYPLSQLPHRPWMPKKHGKRLHFTTVLRWALNGKGGIKLRTLMVGGTRCVSDAWAMTFFEAITPSTDIAPRRTSHRRASISFVDARPSYRSAGYEQRL